jgi:hypothetical protein
MAIREMAQLESVATQQRTDLRQAKGIRTDANGEAYSVYSDRMIDEGNGMIPAYQSSKAAEALLTAKGHAIGAGKGEYWDETKEAYKWHAGKDATARAEAMPDGPEKQRRLAEIDQLRKAVAYQAGPWGGGDPGAKAKAQAVLDEMGLSAEEVRAYQSGFNPEAVDAAGVPDSPDATGGAAV